MTLLLTITTCTPLPPPPHHHYHTHTHRPSCQLYSGDVAYQAGTGLVTNRNEALLLLACTEEVEVCEDCFDLVLNDVDPALTGVPAGANATIKYLSPLEGHNATYHVVLGWDCEYRGAIKLQPSRCVHCL